MIAAIIQARMSSTRLPDKTLMEIEGKPMLWHLLERVKQARSIEKIVLATTYNPKDERILNFAKKYGIQAYRGEENDVLDRFYQVARKIKAETIVRVTPDCPLLCPKVVDKVVREYLKGGYDYVTNTLVYTYPEGCDVEVFSFRALEKAWRECADPAQREHVTSYIKNSGKFKIKNVESHKPVDPRQFKWSVDRKEDLDFVRAVYRHLYKKKRNFSLKEIFPLLKKYPEIKKINSGGIMNEGAYKSILNSSAVMPKEVQLRKTAALKKQAEKMIPSCTQTFSKGPTQFVQGIAPVFLEKGQGSHVWDVDGNEYIDYAMALGPIILGYNYPAVIKAVKKNLENGITFTLPHKAEVELAELLCKIIPCAQMVKFGKNGSDVTSAAVRLSRAYTGRDKIACCGYHGWQDWYVATTANNKGVPRAVRGLTMPFSYNDIRSLERIFQAHKKQVACVIMEPVSIIEPDTGFLEAVKRLTHQNGALLIFDEIVTGFRFSLGGAQEYFNVIPDLACFGKAMGNGFPISALVGTRKVMKFLEEVFYSLTFGGETVSICAAIATIKSLRENKAVSYIWEQGRKLRDGFNVLARGHGLGGYVQSIGYPPRTVIKFKDKNGQDDLLLKSLFQQECIKRGILFTSGHNISFAHSNKDIDYTLRVYNTVLRIIKYALEKNKIRKMILGEPVSPVFRKI